MLTHFRIFRLGPTMLFSLSFAPWLSVLGAGMAWASLRSSSGSWSPEKPGPMTTEILSGSLGLRVAHYLTGS